uniref:Signal recognition particle 9 kDa protein n=1 Tax=Rhinolophus ferrumequinum TaxID=59479 RepID=A0A671G586_RHIFE
CAPINTGFSRILSLVAFSYHFFWSNASLKCLVYRTDQAQDVKKIEKFHSQLMRLMVAKESRSVAMETD